MRNILVVDDTPDNVRLLAEMLTEHGYDVRAASDGAFGLDAARATPPDLILLDIRMPGMDGYAVCNELKADEDTRDIPVIFISALDDVTDKVKGFEVGGVDYISKPFQPEEVLVRVATHLDLQRLRKTLEEKNAELQHTNETLEQRTCELSQTLDRLNATQEKLIQSAKLATVGQLIAGIAHELNTPVGVGVTATSFLQIKTREITEAFSSGSLKHSGLKKYLHLATDAAASIFTNLTRAVELIQRFKQVAIDQTSGEQRNFNLKAYLEDVLISLRLRFVLTRHTITVHCPEDLFLTSYPGAFMQILTHLIEGSVLHGFEHIDQGEITIEVLQQDEELLFRYSDNGKGMDQEQTAKIFDPFFTTKRARGGIGLGMYIVYNLVRQTLGGHIECRTEAGHGITFLMRIPVKSSDDEPDHQETQSQHRNRG